MALVLFLDEGCRQPLCGERGTADGAGPQACRAVLGEAANPAAEPLSPDEPREAVPTAEGRSGCRGRSESWVKECHLRKPASLEQEWLWSGLGGAHAVPGWQR